MPTLPREIAPGIHWLGACQQVAYQGKLLHSYNSVYVVAGDRSSAIVETGHPQNVETVEAQLDRVVAQGIAPIRHLFVTHAETPHAGGMGRLLQRFPDLVASGDVEDLRLAFPEHADRFRPLEVGESLDLGGTELVVVEAVLRDMPRTRWAFDTRRRALFSGDGFAYSHYHEADQCGCLAEEVPELDLPDMTAFFAEAALYWTRFTDIEPYVDRLDALVGSELDARILAPTHGLPIGDPGATLPAIKDGLRRAKAAAIERGAR